MSLTLKSTILGETTFASGETALLVNPEDLIQTLTELRDHHGFDLFSECLGADMSTWPHARTLTGRFEVTYNLVNTATRQRLFVKTSVNDGTPLPTAKHVYLGAEFPEKEIGDLYGIVFTDNELIPGTRFMLPDDWIGFPLRKEYPLGGEDVLFDKGTRGPAVEDKQVPHAGESFEGNTGSGKVSGR